VPVGSAGTVRRLQALQAALRSTEAAGHSFAVRS
jgi:hypothetical protein